MDPQTADQTAALPASVPQSVDVTTPRPAPVATQDAAPSTATVDSQAAPATPSLLQPNMDPPPHSNFAQKVYHGVLGALGGTEDVSYAIDPATQRLIATNAKAGTGTQWKRIIAGVVQGTAAGLSVPPGPAGLTRAAGAGMKAGMQGAAAAIDKKKSDVVDDADDEQKRMMTMAQTQHLNYQNVVSAFENTRLNLKAANEQAAIENAYHSMVSESGGTELGVHKDKDDVLASHKEMPNLAGEFTKGNIRTSPHVDADGNYAGQNFAIVPAKWGDQMNDHPVTLWKLHPATKPGEAPYIESEIVPTGSRQNSVLQNAQTSFNVAIDANQKEQQAAKIAADREAGETARNAATNAASTANNENTQKHADARAAGVQAGENQRATEGNAVIAGADWHADPVRSEIAMGLASGRYKASQLPKRSGKGQITPQQQFTDANAASMEMYGLPFNPTIIEQEDKFASSERVVGVLDGIDRMIGGHGVPSQLQQLSTLAKTAGIGGNVLTNTAEQWMKKMWGDTAAKNFATQLSETQRNLSTLVGNPLIGGGESDLKLQTAIKVFGSNPTLDNLQGAINTVSGILSSSRTQMANSNRYIQQRYGTQLSPKQPTRPANAPTKPAAPAGADSEVWVGGALAGWGVKGKFVAVPAAH